MSEVSDEGAALVDLSDRKVRRSVSSSSLVWEGKVFGMTEDCVSVVDGGEPVVRQYLAHSGAVAIAAVRGEAGEEEILLIRQYRHPAKADLWEIPAGLLDVAGEDPLTAAQRELAEEVDLEAGRWNTLLDIFPSPGNSEEEIQIFLARDLTDVQTAFVREDEEADIVSAWVKLDDALEAVMNGRVHNATAVVAILAVARHRDRSWSDLR